MRIYSPFHHKPPFLTTCTTWWLLNLIICFCLCTPPRSVYVVNGCTVFLVGKDATVDGSVLVSHSNDGEFDTDPRLVKVPSADYPPGTQRPIFFSPESYPRYVGYDRRVPEYFPPSSTSSDDDDDNVEDDDDTSFVPIGYIPQVTHTFAYLEDTYGAVNEMQVGIGESTCSGVFGAIPLGAPNGTALFSVDQLTQIAMERSTNAQDAVELMGTLAEEYGFYGAGEFEGTAESLAVSDPNEAWIFHILPDPTGMSAIWAAQRIPDDSMSILANMFIIREVDPHDEETFLMSDSVHSVAREYGWWKEEDGLLDFTKVYSDGEYAHKFYSGRRMWGGYHLACPSQNFPSDYVDLQSDPVYPVHAKPDRLLSQLDLFQFHRYYYQGTEFDLGAKNKLAGGPFGTPDRWKEGPGEMEVPGNWERSIGLYRTSDTYVVQSRQSESTSTTSNSPNNTGAVLWFGPASPHGTVFTPFLVHMTDVPASFRSGHQQTFDRKSAFWAACFVHNIANLKWSYAIKDIEARQAQLEQASVDMVQRMDELYQRSDPSTTSTSTSTSTSSIMDRVNAEYLKNAETIVSSLWSLSDEIMFKYASGFINEAPDHMSQMPGYPAWWLKEVGYSDGPPPPPTKPKCCDPDPNPDSDSDNKNNNNNSGYSPSLRKRDGEITATATLPLTGKAAMKYFLNEQKTK